VDRQAMFIAFGRRHEEDCLADEAKAISAAAERQRQFKLEAERLAAEQAREQRLIEEACRILDKAASRPYRFSGGTLTVDLSSLNEVERSTVIDA
ncbi:hypothetical protein, partial [Novosphingobium umbonatum]|uniref:hypothetical protein n=1 Tax=Novosphingobium umbonatum TaxID=1908524 RepID=UPI001C705048